MRHEGFTFIFYKILFNKMFSTPLVSLLTGVFNGAFHEGSLPRPILDISIPILPKKEKTTPSLEQLHADTSLKSCCYNPRHLIWLSAAVNACLISPVKSFFTTRRLLNILFSSSSISTEVLVWLDAEKAFDKVIWEYSFL